MPNLRSMGLFALCVVTTVGCEKKEGGEEASTTAAEAEATNGGETATPPAPTTIEQKEVSYDASTVHARGFIAYPAAAGKRPAVIVVHEWWGLNDYARARAKQLAEMGYVGFAIDMYGDGKQAQHPDDAKKFMTEVVSNLPEGEKRFEAAMNLLAQDPRVDASKIAAIGYCFGGAVVLHMARSGANLRAVASFHGNLATQTPMKPGVFAGAIMIATGGSDPFVPQEQVDAFEQEMKAAGEHYDLTVYPNAKHSFTNPDSTAAGEKFQLPMAYDAQADADSWQKLTELLSRVFA